MKVADSATANEDRAYAYDTAWNLTNRTVNTTDQAFTVDSKNQLVTAILESLSYDANGNLTNHSFGPRTFAYDDENQLTSAEVPTDWRVEFTYDGGGRLRKRTDYIWDFGDEDFQWIESGTTCYLYDGRRVIQERIANNLPSVSYTRGADLSGSLEGAGGIGGLLARSHGYTSGNWSTHNFYHADGNGNITYLVNSGQTMVASYRYDPYGNTISLSGSLANANEYRFSSKMIHPNSGLYYYGYRWYGPNLQRWLNRDPIGERGGLNLYQFVRNSPISFLDSVGLATMDADCVKRATDGYDSCIKNCDNAAAVIGVTGLIASGACAATGAGAPIGIGVGAYFFVKGALVRHFCRENCKTGLDKALKECEKEECPASPTQPPSPPPPPQCPPYQEPWEPIV